MQRSLRSAAAHRMVELDFIRGIAILMVIDFHSPAHPLFSPLLRLGFPHFGWAGVQLFFVLSGFLIGNLLLGEWIATNRIRAKRFFARRALKILPQYYFYLLAVLLTGHRGRRELTGNLLNVQNYVGGIPHTWSLAVEEHAYILLVLVLSLALTLRLGKFALFTFAGAIALFTSVLRLWLACHGAAIYYTTHTQVDGIFYGLLLAMIFRLSPKIFQELQQARWLWSLILGCALLYFRFSPSGPRAQALAFDAATWMDIAVLMLLFHSDRVRHLIPYRAVARIGLLSYGIYLWHVSTIAPVMSFAAHIPAPFSRLWIAVMPFAAALALGALTTRLIEVPMLFLRDKLLPPENREIVSAGPALGLETPLPSASYTAADEHAYAREDKPALILITQQPGH